VSESWRPANTPCRALPHCSRTLLAGYDALRQPHALLVRQGRQNADDARGSRLASSLDAGHGYCPLLAVVQRRYRPAQDPLAEDRTQEDIGVQHQVLARQSSLLLCPPDSEVRKDVVLGNLSGEHLLQTRGSFPESCSLRLRSCVGQECSSQPYRGAA
jgi:hypothetical protein